MGCTVLLPVIDNQLEITWDITVLIIQRFLLVLILLLPFEIRDMKYDKQELRTLPQRIGAKRTKIVGYLLVLVFAGLEFFKDEVSNQTILIKLILVLLLLFALKKTNENQNIYFSSFWVESIPLFYLLIMAMA
jgi:hypothetical protein